MEKCHTSVIYDLPLFCPLITGLLIIRFMWPQHLLPGMTKPLMLPGDTALLWLLGELVKQGQSHWELERNGTLACGCLIPDWPYPSSTPYPHMPPGLCLSGISFHLKAMWGRNDFALERLCLTLLSFWAAFANRQTLDCTGEIKQQWWAAGFSRRGSQILGFWLKFRLGDWS